MHSPAVLAPSTTGLLIPRLAKEIPLRFGDGMEADIIAQLTQLGLLEPEDRAEDFEGFASIAMDRASGGLAESTIDSVLMRGDSIGISTWGNETPIALGALLEFIYDHSDRAFMLEAAGYICGILNDHALTCGPNNYSHFEGDYAEHLSEEIANEPSPTDWVHAAIFSARHESRPSVLERIRRIDEDLGGWLCLLEAGASNDHHALLGMVDASGCCEPFVRTGWTPQDGRGTLTDHCIDRETESRHEGGESYEAINTSIDLPHLGPALGMVCAHLYTLNQLQEYTWNLKPKENHWFLTKLCSVTPDTPGQLLLSTELKPEESSPTASPSTSTPTCSP